MTTHTEQTLTTLIESYHALWLLDTYSFSNEQQQQHLENLHRLSAKITAFETEQLKSVNDLLSMESTNLREIVEQLSNTAANDDFYSRVLIALDNSLKVVESLIPVSF